MLPEGPGAPARSRRLPLAGLRLAAGLLLAWALTTFAGAVPWTALGVVLVGLAALSPFLLLPALPVLVEGLRRRRWEVVVPAAVAIALPWSFVVGYVVPAGDVAPGATSLRALLITARNGTVNAQDVAAAVRHQRPDVLVVTELTASLAHDLATAGVGTTVPPRWVQVPQAGQPAAAGLAVYSRFPVDQVEPLSGTTWPAVRARVRVGDRSVTLVAGHAVPPLGRLDRWRADLRTLGAAARVKGPVLVVANLNATPWQQPFRQLVSGRLHDAADVRGRGLRPTWPAWALTPLLPADHALVAGLGVASLDTVTVAGSDHRALSVELAVPRS